ncbi:hypothetical protein MHK_009333, partial [Candidatus Magnetomorum sp. HK-1]
ADQNIYVADYGDDNFQVFSSDGTFLYKYGTTGESTDGSIAANDVFNGAAGIAVDKNGYIYVADYYNNRVQVYSGANSYYVTDARIGIGTSDPEEELEVVGSVKIVDGSQGSGKVFVSDESGVGSWDYVNNVVKILPVVSDSTVSAGDIVQYAGGYVEKGVGGYTTEITFITDNY